LISQFISVYFCSIIFVAVNGCSFSNENNANNTAVMRVLTQLNTVYYDKWAELIKSLKTHTPQQYITTNN